MRHASHDHLNPSLDYELLIKVNNLGANYKLLDLPKSIYYRCIHGRRVRDLFVSCLSLPCLLEAERFASFT